MFAKHFSKNSIPTKIATKKNDAAPMICFIDVLHSANFPQLIIPEPCRIDKLINGSPTALVFPSQRAIVTQDDGDTVCTYDYQKLFQAMLSNFVHYAKLKSKEILFREVPHKKITSWWNNTISQVPRIPSYSEDLEFILQTFLEAFVEFKVTLKQNPSFTEEQLHNMEMNCLLDYCNTMVEYFTQRIESNIIKIQYKQKIIEKRMYKIKKQKKSNKENYYPDIFEFDLVKYIPHKDQPRRFQKALIPIMIYDDILESFFYNQEILQRKLGIEDLGDQKDPREEESERGEDIKKGDIPDIDIANIAIIHFKDLDALGVFRTIPKTLMDSIQPIEAEISAIQLSDFI